MAVDDLVVGVLLILAFLVIANNMSYLDDQDEHASGEWTRTGWILALAGVPLFFAAIVLGAHLGTLRTDCPVVHRNYVYSGLDALSGKYVRPKPGDCVPDEPFKMSFGAAAGVGAIAYSAIWVVVLIGTSIYEKYLSARIKDFVKQRVVDRGRPEAGQELSAGRISEPPRRGRSQTGIVLMGAIGAGALAGWLYALISRMQDCWSPGMAVTIAGPLVLGVFLLAGTMHIGLMGVAFPDRRREWWGRLGGWLMLWGLAWAGICWVALYLPAFVNDAGHQRTWKALAVKYLTPAWVLSTLGGALAGKSKDTGGTNGNVWKDVVARVAPYVFVVGLFGWVSWGIDWVQREKIWCAYQERVIALWNWNGLGNECLRSVSNSIALAGGGALWLASNFRLLTFTLVCAGVALVLSWRVDINEFSMNHFYKNRLVRCFLGASNQDRAPNRFTGFDESDDVPLKELVPSELYGYDGPYLVMNAAMNLTKGKELAWQERMAESFVMTPEYCGYDVWLEEQDSPLIAGAREKQRVLEKEMEEKAKEAKEQAANLAKDGSEAPASAGPPPQPAQKKLDRFGYRPTAEYAFPRGGSKGVHVGTAMAISGAAANPNMGYHSSVPVAFLMTVFNVRLGQWLGNPRHRKTWTRSTPRLGLPYLFNELWAGVDDDAAFVSLSDGGHFENLGIYELVKRRCGLIIACDAEEDGGYGFEGLGNAIRKCRIDMGIDIELDVKDIKPAKPGDPSAAHCAVGTIHYETVDLNAPTGTIIYFKASLTCDEPTDVKNYKQNHDAFPHESTIDQWFTESQFESYRRLGYHVVRASMLGPGEVRIEPVLKTPSLQNELWKKLKEFGFNMDAIPIAVNPSAAAAPAQDAQSGASAPAERPPA